MRSGNRLTVTAQDTVWEVVFNLLLWSYQCWDTVPSKHSCSKNEHNECWYMNGFWLAALGLMNSVILLYFLWLQSLYLFPLATAIHPCITLSYLLNFLHHCVPQVNFSLQKGKDLNIMKLVFNHRKQLYSCFVLLLEIGTNGITDSVSWLSCFLCMIPLYLL